MTPCPGGCALTYASARGAHAHKVNESLNTLHIAEEATTAQRLFAVAADRLNISSSSTQQRRWRGSGGGQLRASEPPIARLMTTCLGGCALFESVTYALCYFVVYIIRTAVREWTYLVDIGVAPGFSPLLNKTYVPKNQVKMKSDIAVSYTHLTLPTKAYV